MVIGCLGNIVFTVSEETVRTLDNMVWTGSARYAVHQRHMTHALTEFVGLDPDKITFDITLSAELGVDPNAEVTSIWTHERDGTALPLTLGSKAYGKYRWNIVSHKMKMQYFDRAGDVTNAVVSISLQEYLGG